LQLFLQRLDATDALPVALEPRHARLLSVSSRGEIALLLPPGAGTMPSPSFRLGTLATVPVTGGTPRAIAEGIEEADWDPAGERLALARRVPGGSQLEYPAQAVLHRSEGYISGVRVSRSGDLVAFFDHPYFDNDRGFVSLADRSGKVWRVTGELESLTGLAWAPDEDEIWFSARDDRGFALFAVSRSGKLRVLRRSPGGVTLRDATADGNLLVTHGTFRQGISVNVPGEAVERDLSWMGSSFVTDLSADGQWILFMEQEFLDYQVWLRRTDGSPPTRLGPGMSFCLSPDGAWALSGLPSRTAPLKLLPTGVGTPRELPGTEGVLWAAWMPDGKSVVWAAPSPTGSVRLCRQAIDGGEPHLIFEGAIAAGILRPFQVSPDGRWVAAMAPDDRIMLYPVAGGEPRELPATLTGDTPSAWTKDGRGLYVSRLDSPPARVYLVEIESGSRTEWRELMPRDPAGLAAVYAFVLTPEGEGYAYSSTRMLDTLYVMTGLR